MREEAGLGEAMILSTCNRVEVYGRAARRVASTRWPRSSRATTPRRLEDIAPHLYRLEGEAAVRHAFRVAASLDSMVIGEPQILGQVKEAYEAAEEAGSLGLGAERPAQPLDRRGEARAHARPAIGRNAVSVSHVAVELARKIFGELRDRSVLLVGRGQDERAGGAPDGRATGRGRRCSAAAPSRRPSSSPPRSAGGRRRSRRCAPSSRAPTS